MIAVRVSRRSAVAVTGLPASGRGRRPDWAVRAASAVSSASPASFRLSQKVSCGVGTLDLRPRNLEKIPPREAGTAAPAAPTDSSIICHMRRMGRPTSRKTRVTMPARSIWVSRESLASAEKISCRNLKCTPASMARMSTFSTTAPTALPTLRRMSW